MAITIHEVTTAADLKAFIRFATELYKYCPNYCPSLEFDELNTFNNKKNPALEVCEFQNFLAYRDGKVVGRVSGIINHKANEHWQRNKVRFGWFDFIDDFEVSCALLDAVAAWGKQKGMTELNGPVGFTDFDHQGLLLEGYEYDSPMASLYNYPYYPAHFEKYGLTKEADWIEYRVFIKTVPEKMDRVAKIAMEKYNLRISEVRSVKELTRKFKNFEYFDVIDQAYQPLYNFQPLTQRQKEYYSKMYFPMLNFDFVTIVVNDKDEIVGIGVGMPDISNALRKCKGRLFPFGWYHVLKALKAKKNMKVFDLLLIAVRPDYQNKGVNALFFYDQIPYFAKYGIEYAETTAILEDNSKNRSNWEYFEKIQHKRRRAYIKTI